MKKLIRALLSLAALVLAAGAAVLALNLLVTMQTRNQIVSAADAAPADCILVLGCGLFPDGTPGRMLTNRLDTAIDLYQRGKAPRLLMSGDHGRADYDEVNAMKRYAVAHGVPADAVFMDHAGFSTYDSMKRAREIFGCGRILVVTQEYHLSRSLWNAQCSGMQAQGVAAELYPYSRRYIARLYIREVLARVKDVFFGLLKPPAEIMGQPISMEGSGSVTDDEATRVWLEQLAAP